ncbi:hypothetical protein ACIBL3_37245 [Kribbella sp. NPDC050124]|uniref:hypothetical protein n=1 Tax=Kribbella sp. NPDC050124 TaxID=3364114 RepID=UPI0037A16A18
MTAQTAEGTDDRDDGPPAVQPGARHGGFGDLQGDVRTVLTDARGAVNTGDGPQFNLHSDSISLLVASTAPELPVRQPIGIKAVMTRIEFLNRVFVRPAGFDLVEARLRPSGTTIVLTGESGSGRRAAAQMLLCPSPQDAASLRFLSSNDLVGDDRLTSEDVTDGDRLLLDVSDLDSSTFAQRQTDLVNCVSIVHEQRANLVILVPDRQERALHDDLKAHQVSFSSPDRWRVLASHLFEGFGLRLPRSGLRPADLEVLDRQPLRIVAQVAVHLDQFRDQSANPATWFSRAIEGLADHEDELTGLLHELDTVEQRTLLLTAAMLEGSSVDAIYFAERNLQKRIGYRSAVDGHRLAQPGITDRIRGLRDHLEILPDGTVRFSRIAFGPAVLAHFWDAYPDLRTPFARWVWGSSHWRAIEPEDRSAVALRFADQAARTNRLSDLFRLVESWSDAGRDEPRRLAVVIMAQVLLRDSTGQAARNQLYSWARAGNLTAALGRIVIELCTDVVAVSHLKQALIRLRWLASRPAVRAEARQAIVQLCGDNRALELFIHVLTDRDRFDAHLCRVVLAPDRLAPNADLSAALFIPRLRQKAVAAWRTALADLEPPDWNRAIFPWLTQHARLLAGGALDLAATLLTAVVDICEGRLASLALLYGANQAWLMQSHDLGPAARQSATAVERALASALADGSDRLQSIEGTRHETD